jgi:hypothetical protein
MVEDWEVVSRTTIRPWLNAFAMLAGAFLVADNVGIHSSATWVLRHRSTGEIRTITARSEQDMHNRLAQGD